MDYLTFISLCSVLWFVKQKGQQSLTYKRKDVITEITAKRLFAAEMSMKKGKKNPLYGCSPSTTIPCVEQGNKYLPIM